MRTHEAAPESDKRAQVDFCWNMRYVQMNNVYCDVMNNGSPLQAWRAGFREGVKMGLDGGDVVDPKHLKNIHKGNYDRLLVWMSVGEDATNGLWAVYGARLGCHMTNIQRKDWDWKKVRDFDWLSNFFKEELFPKFEGGSEMCINTGMTWDWDKLKAETVELGKDIRGVLDLEISDMDKTASRFFKNSTNKTFTTFLNEYRINHATKLLYETDADIKTICYESGFNNFSNFPGSSE